MFTPRYLHVVAGDEIAMPAQHRLRPHQQPHLAKDLAGESVQQRGQEGAVSRGESDSLAVQLSLEDHELVTKGEDLSSFARSLIGSSLRIATALLTAK